MKTLKKLLLMSIALILVTSCSKEDAVEREAEIPEGKIPVKTEVIVDGVLQTNTRASTEAGFTTVDGLYDEGDPVTVTAVANDGYELVKFYDKSGDEKYQDQSSYTFPAKIPQTFKAEFARKYTITVSASPTAGGTVSGGGKFRSGKTCTLTAAANAGYSFDGWYEGSTKLSSSASYSFTVSSNRTIMGKFSLSLIDNPITPKEAGANLGIYGEIDYGDGSFYISVSSKYPLASDINTTLTVTWDSWWSEGGGGDYHNESSTVTKLLRKGENSWLYIVQITCDKGMGAPGSNPSWGVKKMSWQWKTNKSGNSWADSKYNYIITPFGENYPDFDLTNPDW